MALTPQLPLMVTIGGVSTLDYAAAPIGLPPDAVAVEYDRVAEDDTALSGYAVRMVPGPGAALVYRSATITVTVPANRPLPREIGQPWAAYRPGLLTEVSETHSDRSRLTTWLNAEVISNSLRVTRQADLQRAYYSGTLTLRVLFQGG